MMILLNHPTVYSFTKTMADLETLKDTVLPSISAFVQDVCESLVQEKQKHSFPDFDSTDLLNQPRDILARFHAVKTWTEMHSILEACNVNDFDTKGATTTTHQQKVTFAKTLRKIVEIQGFMCDQIEHVMDECQMNHSFYVWMRNVMKQVEEENNK